MLSLPNDPIILLSFVNTQLRDNYKSLTEFCKAYVIQENVIEEKLAAIDYSYDSTVNRFVS